ncbi:MAG: phosphatase PAP2 family protein [Chloroflexi bacterium]|nr:phosphatase PAP2 family protein [Chloroflexota bacterium]
MDAAFVLWLNGWVGRSPWLDTIAKIVAGDYLVPVALSLMLLGMWFGVRDPRRREGQQKAVGAAMAGMGFANLANLLLNRVYFRPRPFVHLDLHLLFYRPTDSSFPANPAVVGFALAWGIWLGDRRLGTLAFLLALAWSIARIYAGVIYPTDMLGGAAIGIAVTSLVALAFRLLEPLPTVVLRAAQRLFLA